ncbi:methyltransferase [Micromonospora sp. NPDC126480]|uniref:methyltransferase n=1 Tax=Micromonospora sp. NPDC126480 TaxID=3155312 RepID=UPI003316DD4E
MTVTLSPRALMSLLVNGPRAMDVLRTALDLGLLDTLEPGPVRLDVLAAQLGVLPLRLYKFLDCIESLGFLHRVESGDDIGATSYRAVPGLRVAVDAVVGPGSTEQDRERYPWQQLHGRLAESLRGEISIDGFAWPPKTAAQTAEFERSMALGLGPAIQAVRRHSSRLWSDRRRLLDVGGGDGTLAAHILDSASHLRADVFNLPAVAPLVAATREARGHSDRLGFIGGDFFASPLPRGYDALSFVRVLHDWPNAVARELVRHAYAALEPGGLILICEEFRSPDRLAMQFFWSYFLIGVDSSVSRLREVAFYTELLTEVGFHSVAVLPGTWELVTAYKPTR